MKTILSLLLLLVSLSIFAKPEFLPLPGTPEALVTEAAAETNSLAIVVPAAPSKATKPATMDIVPVSVPAQTSSAKDSPSIVRKPSRTAPVAKPATAKASPAAAQGGVIVMGPSSAATAVPTVSPAKIETAAPTPAPAISSKATDVAAPSPASVAVVEVTSPPVATPAATPDPVSPVPATAPIIPATPRVPAAPAAPAPPASVRPPRNPRAAEAAAAKPDSTKEMISASVLHFQAMPLEQVLDFYSELVNRTMLRPAQLPAASITINARNDLTKEEAIQALDSVLGLNGIAMIPVGTKFMKVVPIAQANQEGAALSTITNSADLPEIGQYITYVVQLKYAKPTEVATSLQPFQKVPNSVIPLDSNGILIIRDYTENVKRMLEMIDRIDVAVPSEFISEVIPIKYALAADISSALSSISGSGGNGTSVGSTRAAGATAGSRNLAGNQNNGQPNTGNRNVGNTAGGNANVGLGGGAAGAQQSFQSRLQSIIQRAQSSGDIQLIGPNKIIADERTNALLVFATREDMATIKDIIGKLDVVLAQVLIEAIIMDVSLGDNFSFGVSAGQRPTSYGGTNGSAAGGNFGGQLPGALSFLNNLVANSNGTFSASQIVPYGTGDGLSYFGRLNQTWDFTLSAIAGNNNIKVLARPRIQTSHAVPASIFVGETRPYITGTYYDSLSGSGSSRSQYQQTQIGISLNVLPLINPEGLVVMDIQQQVQQVGGSVTIDGNQVPITQDQNASTKVAVYNGQTIVLGGFIRDQKESSNSGVPFLKDIPLLGSLFRNTTTTSGRRELLVLIRPTVLPTPELAAMQAQVERNRLPGVKAAEAEFNTAQVKEMKKASKKQAIDPEAQYEQAGQIPKQPAQQGSGPIEMK